MIKMKKDMPILRAKVMRELYDLLIHDKEHGHYDSELDKYFDNLNTWCSEKHGIDFDEIM